ncbi:MAG TPA: hypothetical protein VHL77_00240, partial [Ferruginibacter sp.]|nr:hypothetical protein [Ferruginibacter sp.]
MTVTQHSAIFSKYGRSFTGIMWLISTLLYLFIHGVVTNQEAGKYIEEAHRYIDNGDFSAPRYYFYCATLFILVFAIKTHIGMFGAFVIQALLNLFAYNLFYKALTRIFQSELTPLLIILYLLSFSPYQSWIVFLYTESVFSSAILILLSALILYKPVSIKNILVIIAVLGFCMISRPLGILFGVGIYLYFFYHANRKWKIILACCSVIFLGLGYFFVNIVFSSVKDWRITQAFEEESIICDLPSAGPYQKLHLAASGTPVYKLWYYCTHNFTHFAQF